MTHSTGARRESVQRFPSNSRHLVSPLAKVFPGHIEAPRRNYRLTALTVEGTVKADLVI